MNGNRSQNNDPGSDPVVGFTKVDTSVTRTVVQPTKPRMHDILDWRSIWFHLRDQNIPRLLNRMTNAA
jgi:hypothetical protein